MAPKVFKGGVAGEEVDIMKGCVSRKVITGRSLSLALKCEEWGFYTLVRL